MPVKRSRFGERELDLGLGVMAGPDPLQQHARERAGVVPRERGASHIRRFGRDQRQQLARLVLAVEDAARTEDVHVGGRIAVKALRENHIGAFRDPCGEREQAGLRGGRLERRELVWRDDGYELGAGLGEAKRVLPLPVEVDPVVGVFEHSHAQAFPHEQRDDPREQRRLPGAGAPHEPDDRRHGGITLARPAAVWLGPNVPPDTPGDGQG